jgi:hypothetical protein
MNSTTFHTKTLATSRIRKKKDISLSHKRYKTDTKLNVSLTLSPTSNSSVSEENFDPTIGY